MKPLLNFLSFVLFFCALETRAQEETLTEVPLGQPGELKLIHVSPNPNFPREGIVKYSTTNDKLNVSLKPGRYYYRYRSNSNVQRAVSKSGKIIVDVATTGDQQKNNYSIQWTPPIDPKTNEKIPFFWSVTDSKGNFIVKDQVITDENPSVPLLHPGTYFWTMTDEIGASWTVPKQFYVNPFPPSVVTAVVNKDRSVDIAWKASSNLEGFVVKIFDDEGYLVYHSTMTDRFISIPELQMGKYRVDVSGTITMNGKFGVDAEPTFDLVSKPVSTTFEIPEGSTTVSPLVILSPVGRVNFEGQKYIFSWTVRSQNAPKKFRLQVKGRDQAGTYVDIKTIDTTAHYDETIFQTLPLGVYKFRVGALNEKDEPIPGMSDKSEFSIESKIGEARLGRVALDNVTFGPEMSLMTYNSTSTAASNSFSAQMTGLFVRHEKTGQGTGQIDSKFPYSIKEIRSQFFTQATTMTNAELTLGCGESTSPNSAGWITKYGIHGSLARVPDVVGSPTSSAHLNFLTFRPRIEFGKVNKHFSFQLNFELSVPLLQVTDTLTMTQDPLTRVAAGYRATADMQFPFFWPWSAGAQLGYERNDFHYKSPQDAQTTDSTLSGIGVKLYLSYPY